MTLRVQNARGAIEVLEIQEPLLFRTGTYQNAIVGADRTEYFFTKDGYYDGLGRPGGPQNLTRLQ